MEDSAPFLLPSEIARLVYGQLKSMNCPSVATKFLEMSPHLEESRELIKEDRTFWTQAHGLPLSEILEQYLNADNLILKTVDELSDVDKFKDSVAALRFLLTLNRLNSIEKDTDSGADTPATTNIGGDEIASTVNIEIRPSPKNDANARNNKNVSIDICNTDSTASDCSRNEQSSKRNRRKTTRYDNFILPQRCQTRIFNNSFELRENSKKSTRKKKVDVPKPKEEVADTVPTFQKESSEESCIRFKTGRIWSNEKTFSEKLENQSCSLKKSAMDRKSREPAVISNEPIFEADRRTSGRFLRSCTKANEPVTALMNVGAVKSRRKMTKNLTVSSNDAASNKEPKINYPARENENIDVARMQRMLLEDYKMHELIAENINKKINATPEKKIDTCTKDHAVIESIAEQTLSENLCDEFIQSLLSCSQNLSLENEANENIFDNPLVHNEVDQPVERIPNSQHQRLQDDMNEFITFNYQKSNDEQVPQSDVIIIEMQQDEQNTSTLNDYVVECNGHSSYVVCATDVTSNQNKCEEIKDDEIIAGSFYSEYRNELQWDIGSSLMLAPANVPVVVARSQGSEPQICHNPLPALEETKKNDHYRPIAPKPELCKIVNENISAARPRRRIVRK